MQPCARIDPRRVDSPAYVIDLAAMERNLELLAGAQEASGCGILLALKGFAAWSTFPLVGKYLDGVAASGPDEARLGAEEFGKEVHTYCPAFDETSLRETIRYSDHVTFNSPSQIDRFRVLIDEHASGTSFGLRINPEHSEVDVPLYDPCASGSRLGTTVGALGEADLRGIDGLHFHTLCELGADALQRTLAVVESRFEPWLDNAKWVNFGGGHHITKPGYDVGLLVHLVRDFKQRHQVQVFLEPGEAIGLNAGVLVASVLDIIEMPYVQVARAKGLTTRRVNFIHILKNAMIPIITVIGLDFGSYLNGAVLTETIFGWDGIGRFAMEGIIKRDYPVVMGTIIVGTIAFVLINLLVDLTYQFLDPRVRLDSGKGR